MTARTTPPPEFAHVVDRIEWVWSTQSTVVVVIVFCDGRAALLESEPLTPDDPVGEVIEEAFDRLVVAGFVWPEHKSVVMAAARIALAEQGISWLANPEALQ